MPLSRAAIFEAIELNGTAVDANRGRRSRGGGASAHDLPPWGSAGRGPRGALPEHQRLSQSLDEVIARRAAQLVEYQDAAYASPLQRPRRANAWRRDCRAVPGSARLTEAVAGNWHKLLAYKDEYEVARLYAETDFLQRLAQQFEGDWRPRFHSACCLWA